MILRVLLPLQLLGIPRHVLAFHVFPAACQMFRSSFNVKALLRSSPSARATVLAQHHQKQQQQQQRKRSGKALAATTAKESSTGMARFTDTTEEASSACFLENDGRWIDYEEAFTSRGNEGQDDDSNYLRELTVVQLRREARERGQTSTGPRAALMKRLVSKQAPDPTRPRRRNHKPVLPLPHGYVERLATPRPRALHPYTKQLRVLSWNVNGIRARLDKEEGRKALQSVIAQERPHVLGVQEIKVASPGAKGHGTKKSSESRSYVDVVKSLLPDYDTIWLSSFPPARSGYAGTALFIRKKREWDTGCPTLLSVRGGIGHTVGDLEGRVTTAEYDIAFVVNVYTPNSGDGLKRLAFRTDDWDEAFAAYVKGLEKIKPVVVVGDLNVAHEDKDFYNPEEKRTRKSAGTTPEERSSFARKLLGRHPPPSCFTTDSNSAVPPTNPAESDIERNGQVGNGDGDGLALVDTFRKLHPGTTGVFTFWSVRAGNRPVNRGMRLDYCLASQSLANGECGVVHDAFVLDRDTVGISDHCPVGVVLRLGDHYHQG